MTFSSWEIDWLLKRRLQKQSNELGGTANFDVGSQMGAIVKCRKNTADDYKRDKLMLRLVAIGHRQHN